MHLDEERVQRLLHDEPGSAGSDSRLHLAGCPACRELVEEARAQERRILELLAQVDHPIAQVDPYAVLAERNAAGRAWARRAAAVIAGAALVGTAYALPGSPLPAALDRLLGGDRPGRDTVSASREQRDSAPPAGIAVPPEEGLEIRLVAEGDEGVATIQLTEDEEIVVRAMEGHATFTSDPGRLTVRSSGPVRLDIRIPRAASSVAVLAGSTPVFRKLPSGPVTETLPDSSGRYVIPLRGPS
jgi:hypothetical protein